MKILFLFFIILVIIQWYFKTKQTKEFLGHYNNFLQNGNVLVERSKGVFSGAIILIQLDEEANIKGCLLLTGATFFSSWCRCEELISKNLLHLELEDFDNYKKPVRKVIAKAIQSYQIDSGVELNSKMV
ncbi:transcriptional regulator GutM [Oceanobacillus alkalisoli]|uniref:transcriptional regulator GutM n=1 Tax=Oceanobacillus alkalisoli TaxID=2925113 RepID=UPI001EEFC14B|nr:transcriptional regulator GutM [Oceanobacillus alkalisoli]MCF3944106.1 hypothetical protein [Oceanobacillus alkalisoli]MCG5102514.1 hypothetical protein [Oceanobacillus alkalisoli]